MKKIPLICISALLAFTWIHTDLQAEKISLKISYKTNTISRGDIFDWVDSNNMLWEDWQNLQGGSLEGQFTHPNYKANYEFELRIPIVAGFALSLAGSSRQKSRTEDTVLLTGNGEGSQVETHLIKNAISALPFKIGASFRSKLPFLANWAVCAGAGRLIFFAKYENTENHTLTSQFLGTEYNYWYEIEGTYRSEGLGFYANLSVEYDIFKFLAVGIGMEQRWAKADGFKGGYTYKRNYRLDEPGYDTKGKASLYFYELKPSGMGDYYKSLTGHIDRPAEGNIDNPIAGNIKNIRQGKINMGGFSLTIGIRFII